MKTKLPEPQFSFEGDWYSESQLRAAMWDAFNEGIEDAAKVCNKEAKGFIEYNLAQSAHGCNCCADAIRKLKEQV